jgi:hypothetical protein
MKDAERRVNYGIQDMDSLASSIGEIETAATPGDVSALTREAVAQVRLTHGKLCELFTALYTTRMHS